MTNTLRTLLAGAALAGATTGAAAAELSVVHGSPTGHVIAQAVDNWMACMEGKGIEDLSFRYYPAGQISSLPELLQSLQSGVGRPRARADRIRQRPDAAQRRLDAARARLDGG